ncbi:MAG: hypothetical protein COV52_02920 [Gammaproteobacteria bacterium CG11_big_fil_rev_8_21_14_0_20_46_22]|nr:MAG: hypothetical protein COW05_02140 [Gammaproteobacteria bacterium CG12_big_fil_rev_8_21_14_0_65_46_12]PIR11727.1 MAG: hypothetical protein COV52_02920 [Gammaproteobacteria bacterium CG11_big_fil_rev_8_21_14_0_20_46_22]
MKLRIISLLLSSFSLASLGLADNPPLQPTENAITCAQSLQKYAVNYQFLIAAGKCSNMKGSNNYNVVGFNTVGIPPFVDIATHCTGTNENDDCMNDTSENGSIQCVSEMRDSYELTASNSGGSFTLIVPKNQTPPVKASSINVNHGECIGSDWPLTFPE